MISDHKEIKKIHIFHVSKVKLCDDMGICQFIKIYINRGPTKTYIGKILEARRY